MVLRNSVKDELNADKTVKKGEQCIAKVFSHL
jgi:hypothetical protein